MKSSLTRILFFEPPLPHELSLIEREVIDLPIGEGVALSSEKVELLLASPVYHPSLGEPARAKHFRRGLPDGTGLHLVVTDDRAELHRDHFDPHASPSAMLLHLATDSPTQFASFLSVGLTVLRRLGR